MVSQCNELNRQLSRCHVSEISTLGLTLIWMNYMTCNLYKVPSQTLCWLIRKYYIVFVLFEMNVFNNNLRNAWFHFGNQRYLQLWMFDVGNSMKITEIMWSIDIRNCMKNYMIDWLVIDSLIDWLIDWLNSNSTYFMMHIEDENKLTIITIGRLFKHNYNK